MLRILNYIEEFFTEIPSSGKGSNDRMTIPDTRGN